ncbi:MAG: monothiol glutaredoxin, Grx4 family [Rickettsiales bacterium]|nr:monothiol glutaredoxin, Grx4 family [Rickettsiales bacterium]|tara:strand:+ start:654 stop:1001 length:348 start_codon:yes stop_codon:yes gene_type:complete
MTDNPVFDRIRDDVTSNDVVLFMKGTRKLPQCGFSATVVAVLERLGVEEYKDVNVLLDMELRQGIKDFTDWPTIPQLYVKGEFIGGCDIIKEMYEAGELRELLQQKGVPLKDQAA